MAKGDEAAFTEIYNRYWEKLYVIAYNRLEQQQFAEDIVHDVFICLWEGRTRLTIEKLENYLATATKYAVWHKLEKINKQKTFVSSLPADPSSPSLVEKKLHSKQILKIIKTEVDTLPKKCKLVFKQSRELHKSTKEISEALDISPKTVEGHITHALRQIKKATEAISLILSFFSLL